MLTLIRNISLPLTIAAVVFFPPFIRPGIAEEIKPDIDLCFSIANNQGEVWSFYTENTEISLSQMVDALGVATYGTVNFMEPGILKNIDTLMQLMKDGHVVPEDIVTEIKKSCIIHFAPASYG